jgi:hypothetical protein
MWGHVVRYKFTDVSEESIASIFGIEEQVMQARSKQLGEPSYFLLVACLPYSSTLNTEAARSSEMSVNFCQTTQRNILENSTLHSHRHENLKSITS